MASEIMDISEAAIYLNIKKGTLYRLAKNGQVPGRNALYPGRLTESTGSKSGKLFLSLGLQPRHRLV